MDTLNEHWLVENRIGENIPNYELSTFLSLEEKIFSQAANLDFIAKYNVGPLIGGVPPKGDKDKIRDSRLHGVAYHDSLGGLLISTRNAELNCRTIDRVVNDASPLIDLTSTILAHVKDKYVLSSDLPEPEEVIFLPGSNLFNTVDWDRVDEIMVDYPNAMIKLHPVTTPGSVDRIKTRWGARVISETASGMYLLNHAKTIWTSYNSEIGLIAAMMKIPFGTINKWGDTFSMIYAPIYRHFKYKDVEYNYTVISKVVSSNYGGFVFSWQQDCSERIDTYFSKVSTFKSGMIYPYA